MEKYILLKGCNGFGNMMSVLSFAYVLAKKNNAILVIDWTHPEWKLGFDKYFKLNDVKYMQYDDFKTIIKNNNLSIYPQIFNRDNIQLPLWEAFPSIETNNMYEEIFKPVINILNSNKDTIYDVYDVYDVYVYSYNWLGNANIKELWANLELQPTLKLEIENKITNLGEYNAMHIRHTDNKNVSCGWVTDYLKCNLDKKIYIATDNEIVLDICKKLHPNIINFTHFYEKGKPLHLQEMIESDKNNSNIDVIVDMYILINAKEIRVTSVKTVPYMTTYSIMAMALRS
jgi:hypothetical protein